MMSPNTSVHVNHRVEGESFHHYRRRRKASQTSIKKWLRGRTVWDPRSQGTYDRRKHGAISRVGLPSLMSMLSEALERVWS